MRTNGNRTARVVLAAAFILITFHSTTYAYIDPGVGSFMLQAILAFFAAIGVGLGIFRNKIAGLWKRLFSRKSAKTADDPEAGKTEETAEVAEAEQD
jgi:hypothetical protein